MGFAVVSVSASAVCFLSRAISVQLSFVSTILLWPPFNEGFSRGLINVDTAPGQARQGVGQCHHHPILYRFDIFQSVPTWKFVKTNIEAISYPRFQGGELPSCKSRANCTEVINVYQKAIYLINVMGQQLTWRRPLLHSLLNANFNTSPEFISTLAN